MTTMNNPKFKFFDVCVDKERKDIMTKALTNYLNSLKKAQASRMMIRETKSLINEVEDMPTC